MQWNVPGSRSVGTIGKRAVNERDLVPYPARRWSRLSPAPVFWRSSPLTDSMERVMESRSLEGYRLLKPPDYWNQSSFPWVPLRVVLIQYLQSPTFRTSFFSSWDARNQDSTNQNSIVIYSTFWHSNYRKIRETFQYKVSVQFWYFLHLIYLRKRYFIMYIELRTLYCICIVYYQICRREWQGAFLCCE